MGGDFHTCSDIPADDFGFYCTSHADCGDIGICDHTMSECQPVCRIGGCYCTENDQCDSNRCNDFHCRDRMFLPKLTTCLLVLVFVVIVALCVVYRVLCKKRYVIINRYTGYGYVSDAGLKPPEFKKAKEGAESTSIQSQKASGTAAWN